MNIFLQFLLEHLFGLLGLLCIVIFVLIAIAYTTLLERKYMSSVQRRRGPNMAGLFGILQPLADGLKLATKELIFPTNSDLFLFILAPILTFFFSLLIWIVVPYRLYTEIVLSPYSLLVVLAISACSVYGIIFAGWASNNKYSFLGAIRTVSQMIAYEINMTLVFGMVITITDSFSLAEIVQWQKNHTWLIFFLAPAWFIYVVLILAETCRAPFDVTEAEAELVAGYNVEYSGMIFALFFLGEYGNIIMMGVLSTFLFFGGWLPIPIIGSFFKLSPFIWLGIKSTLHVMLMVLIRATLPRYRYDQVIKLGWKTFMPILVGWFMWIIALKYMMTHYSTEIIYIYDYVADSKFVTYLYNLKSRFF